MALRNVPFDIEPLFNFENKGVALCAAINISYFYKTKLYP